LSCHKATAEWSREPKTIFRAAERQQKDMNGQNRKDIKPGLEVEIVMKQDQRTGKRTRGVVRDVLTKSAQHPHGIKVRLESGEVGRVQQVIDKPELS
jgi:uncharacterized repeat protein (TIGR03833 family)